MTTRKNIIIGLSGKIGSGKNYIGENILYKELCNKGYNVVVMAFGDYLKMICCVKDGISYEKLFYDKDLETRKVLQTRGMKERETDDLIFIKMLDCHMRIAFDRNINVVIISDLRFGIELDYLIEKKATLFRINAPMRTKDKMMKECNGDEKMVDNISNHTSETNLDNCDKFNFIIDNDYENESNITSIISKCIEMF